MPTCQPLMIKCIKRGWFGFSPILFFTLLMNLHRITTKGILFHASNVSNFAHYTFLLGKLGKKVAIYCNIMAMDCFESFNIHS